MRGKVYMHTIVVVNTIRLAECNNSLSCLRQLYTMHRTIAGVTVIKCLNVKMYAYGRQQLIVRVGAEPLF